MFAKIFDKAEANVIPNYCTHNILILCSTFESMLSLYILFCKKTDVGPYLTYIIVVKSNIDFLFEKV